MNGAESERYWDEKARENAWFYVHNELDYDDPDTESFWASGDVVVDRMLELGQMQLGPQETVLDIGCGVGRLTRALAKRVDRVYGLDVSREMLELAREHNPQVVNVEWLHGDGAGLGVVGDASVDGCFSHVVFQHIPDPQITLNYVREMGRVLRPGGWALFQVSNDPKIHQPPGGLRSKVKAALSGGRDDKAWWGSWVETGDLRAAAADGGLDVERLEGEGTQFMTVLARKR